MGAVSCYEKTTGRAEPKPQKSQSEMLPKNTERGAELVLGFELPDGTPKKIVSSRRPMGLKYTKTAPFMVTDVNTFSHANELGVKKGWRLRFIEHEDMAGKDGDYIRAVLCKKAHVLPLM